MALSRAFLKIATQDDHEEGVMARKTSEDPTRIWKFAAKIERHTESAATEILYKSNRYYNRLVEIERARQERYMAVRRIHAPELAALEDEWSALEEGIVSLYREAKGERLAHWRATDGERRRILPPEFETRKAILVERQKAVSGAAKGLRATFAELLAPARAAFRLRAKELCGDAGPRTRGLVNARVLAAMLIEDEWHPAWKEIARSDDAAHTATIEARSRCGLYGGTYLGIEEAFQRAKKDCLPRPPSFRPFSGGGKIQVQIGGDATWATASGPRHRIEALERREGAGKRSTMIRITFDQQREKQGKRKKGSPVLVSAICKLHRIPPSGAPVKWIALVLRRVGRRMTSQLQITMEHASFSEPRRSAGQRAPVHVRLGWSRVEGGIRIASGLDHDIVCPDSLLGQEEAASRIEGVRDDLAFEAVRRMRKAMWMGGFRIDGRAWQRFESDRGRADLRRGAIAYAEHVLGGRETVAERWTSWRASRKGRGDDLYARVRELRMRMPPREAHAWWCFLWAKKDAHLEQYIADSRRRFVNRRDARYRQEAIRIATEYASLTIDDYDIAALKKLEPLTMPGTGVRDMAQAQLQHAAPGRFREILIDVMGARCTPCGRPDGEGKPGPACERPGGEGKSGPARTRKLKRDPVVPAGDPLPDGASMA